ncbi:MAG: polysaccharide deacetylase family protein [Candidatus Sulfotelmatobacter sp.]|jgi:peptidoglycan/xylan/chitin deacetylase (PgdA/CDA1 family)
MIKQLRRAALTILKSCGAFNLVKDSRWRQQKLLILCYHGVSLEDEDQWRPFLYMRPQQLERRLDILREGKYTVLPLAEALERLYRKDLPPRSVALTFDDGGYDFYKQAWPRLRRYGFQATVYLTTYYSELQLPVLNLILSYMLWKARDIGRVDLNEFGINLPVTLSSVEGREEVVSQLLQWAAGQDLNGEERDLVAVRLARRLGIDYQRLQQKRILHLMNPEEVKQLAAEGVDFQLHTHRHRMPLSEELFRREIRDNRVRIANAVGGKRAHFCYPSGAYRPEFLGWLANEEVVSATTCDTGFATPETNPLLLPRLVDTIGRSDLEFESWACGIGHFLSRRKRGQLAYVPN